MACTGDGGGHGRTVAAVQKGGPMATLTVWKFDTADGADRALETLQHVQTQYSFDLIDGAVVSFPEGAKKPTTRQLHTTKGAGALTGGFWGFLFGLIFFVPLLGLTLGAGLGALMGSLANIGIDDDFIEQVRAEVKPGTSALFLYTQHVEEGLLDDLKKTTTSHPVLIQSNLSPEQEARLRAAFGGEPAPAAL
jgi:uncharacterized membrane protein